MIMTIIIIIIIIIIVNAVSETYNVDELVNEDRLDLCVEVAQEIVGASSHKSKRRRGVEVMKLIHPVSDNCQKKHYKVEH